MSIDVALGDSQVHEVPALMGQNQQRRTAGDRLRLVVPTESSVGRQPSQS